MTQTISGSFLQRWIKRKPQQKPFLAPATDTGDRQRRHAGYSMDARIHPKKKLADFTGQEIAELYMAVKIFLPIWRKKGKGYGKRPLWKSGRLSDRYE